VILPSARADLLAARHDWKANFRLKRRFRAIRGRKPWRAQPIGPAWPLLIFMAGRKIAFQNRMRFAADMPGRWGLQCIGLSAERDDWGPFE